MTTTYTVNSQTVNDSNGSPICIVDSVTKNVVNIPGGYIVNDQLAEVTPNGVIRVDYNGRTGYGYVTSSSAGADSDWINKDSYSITYDLVPTNIGLRSPHGFTNDMGMTSLSYSTTFDEPYDIVQTTIDGQSYANKPATLTFSAQWSCRATSRSAVDNAQLAKPIVLGLEYWPTATNDYSSYLVGASSNFGDNGQCSVSKTYYLIPNGCGPLFATEKITAQTVGSPQKYSTREYTRKLTGFSTIGIDDDFNITSINPAGALVSTNTDFFKETGPPGRTLTCQTVFPALPAGACEHVKSSSVEYNYSEPSMSFTMVYSTEPLNCDRDGMRREWSKARYTNQKVYVEMFGWNNTDGKSVIQNYNVDKNPKTEYVVTVSDISSCGTGAGLKAEAESVFSDISDGGRVVYKVLTITNNRATLRVTEQDDV